MLKYVFFNSLPSSSTDIFSYIMQIIPKTTISNELNQRIPLSHTHTRHPLIIPNCYHPGYHTGYISDVKTANR